MGYYLAWGDTKMMYSSEEEGYESCASDNEKKRNYISTVSEKVVSKL